MTPDDLATWLRKKHVQGDFRCMDPTCGHPWPCSTARLLARIEVLSEALAAIADQAGDDLYGRIANEALQGDARG